METTEEACVRALRTAASRLGASPTKAQYEELGLTPASATILRVMGGWNAAKEAAGLETYDSRGARVGPKPDDVELPEGETWEEMSVDQRWHYRNVDRNCEQSLRRRRRLREWLRDIKADRGCSNCSEDDAVCLEFHHHDRKTMDISEMVTYGYGRDALREEIRACSVLCANCHRLRHDEVGVDLQQLTDLPGATSPSSDTGIDPDSFPDRRDRRRIWVREYKRLRGCSRCGEKTAACLDLHHGPDVSKRLSVSESISREHPAERILAEVERCVVLCANCHRREHGSGDPGE